jgi:hypothetical protein
LGAGIIATGGKLAKRLAQGRLAHEDRRLRRPSTGAWLVLLVVVIAAYFVPRGISWNADSHIFLTASIVDRGTLNIDPLAPYTQDRAFANGHYYADKAPGLSLAAVPVYAVLKLTLLSGKPYTSQFAVPADQRLDFLVRYLLALVYAAVPTGLLAALLYWFLARFGLKERWRVAIAMVYALGTMAHPFADQFFSHQLAALLVFGGFVLAYRLRHGELAPRFALVAGLLLGYGVITEYPTALIAGAIGIYALTAPTVGRRLAALLAAGTTPALLVGAGYNTLAFGGPLSQGYAHLAGPEVFRVGQAQGIMGITYPHLDALWQTTLGPYRGMLLVSPVLALAIPGFVYLWRQTAWRAETLLVVTIVAVYFIFSISYFEWDGGFSFGPRQFLPALPFLVLPLGLLLTSERSANWRRAYVALGLYSMAVVSLATATGALFDPQYTSPLTQVTLARLAGFATNAQHAPPTLTSLIAALIGNAPLYLTARLDNNWGMVFGLPGLLQVIPLALVVAGLSFWHWRRLALYSRLAQSEHWQVAAVVGS